MSDLPDCQTCGACCVEAGDVVIEPGDKTPTYLTRSVRGRVGFASWEAEDGVRILAKEIGGRCRALRGQVGVSCRCNVYDRRPAICRAFPRGSEGCLAAREIMTWKLSKLEMKPWGYDARPLGRPKAATPQPGQNGESEE